MEKESSLPQTVIAVVGDTGSGKSSLLNALLEHGNILPTSGMRACTAVVVRVSSNETSDNYEADVEFLAEKEWMDELQILLKELTGRNGKIRTQQPDRDTEAAVAWNKIRAVYGLFSADATLDTFRCRRSVTCMLGRTKQIARRSVIQYFSRYVGNMAHNVGTAVELGYWQCDLKPPFLAAEKLRKFIKHLKRCQNYLQTVCCSAPISTSAE